MGASVSAAAEWWTGGWASEEELSIWAACGPGWHGDGWGSEGFLMLSQHEDGNLQTTPLLCFYAVDFGVTRFRPIFFFCSKFTNQNSNLCCLRDMDFCPLVIFFSLFNIWMEPLSHTCSQDSLSCCTLVWFFFLTSRFFSFWGSDVYQSNQMSLYSLSRKHTLTPSHASHKGLAVNIRNEFSNLTFVTPNSQ